MTLQIRTARLEDAAEMVAILNPIIDHGGLTLMQVAYTVEEQADYVRNFPENGVFLVAEDETGGLLGMQGIEPISSESALSHVGDISTFVSLENRSQGVGKALAQELFFRAKQKGYRKLMAMVRRDNLVAVGFYQSIGFEQVGVLKQHACIHGQYLDEVLLEKLLK